MTTTTLRRRSKSKPKAAVKPLRQRVTPFKKRAPLLLRQSRVLTWASQVSTPVAMVLIVGVLGLYGWSVNTQTNWGDRYDNIDALRKEARELKKVNSRRNHQLTEDAERNAQGFVPKSPTNSIFLPKQPPRPTQPKLKTQLNPQPPLEQPLAY